MNNNISDYPLYQSSFLKSSLLQSSLLQSSINIEIGIIVIIEEKDNKPIEVKLTPSTLIGEIIEQISNFLVLPNEEKQIRALFYKDRILDSNTTIEKNSIQNSDTLYFKKCNHNNEITSNAIMVQVNLLEGKSYRFYVDPFSFLQEIGNSISNLLNYQDNSNIEYEFFDQTARTLDTMQTFKKLNINNGDVISCKRVNIGGSFIKI